MDPSGQCINAFNTAIPVDITTTAVNAEATSCRHGLLHPGVTDRDGWPYAGLTEASCRRSDSITPTPLHRHETARA
jgi:hypothetical protein